MNSLVPQYLSDGVNVFFYLIGGTCIMCHTLFQTVGFQIETEHFFPISYNGRLLDARWQQTYQVSSIVYVVLSVRT